MINNDAMDMVQLLSFIYGVANYNENLTQNDKAEIMNKLDAQTKEILLRIEQDLEEQNKILREILKVVKNDDFE